MKVAIHQPNFLPYLGFFDKMEESDLWVHYDDAQFTPRDFHHRNRIATKDGPFWLTVPIIKPDHNGPQPIKDIKIRRSARIRNLQWEEYFLRQIEQNYGKSPFFGDYSNPIAEIFRTGHLNLRDLNLDLIEFLRRCFNIKTEVVFSSELSEREGINTRSTQKIIDLCKFVEADTYLSGQGARDYLDEELIRRSGINLEYQEFHHPVYEQTGREEFIKNMAALDFLFNRGSLYEN